jgi:secreted PhoX family phosphatase
MSRAVHRVVSPRSNRPRTVPPSEPCWPGLDRFEGRIAVLKDQDAESTGPIWSPGQDTMFLSIQHPGDETSVKGGVYGQPATYTSYWPRGNKTTGTNPSEPLPSVIAVRRS